MVGTSLSRASDNQSFADFRPAGSEFEFSRGSMGQHSGSNMSANSQYVQSSHHQHVHAIPPGGLPFGNSGGGALMGASVGGGSGAGSLQNSGSNQVEV